MRNFVFALVLVVAFGAAPAGAESLVGTTASGKQVRAAEGQEPPWKKDLVSSVMPAYPNRDRFIGNAGTGVFRIVFNPASGAVSKVETVRSTGYDSLNQSAINSFKQWRIRPGSWRAIEMKVSYRSYRTRGEALSEMQRYKAQEAKRKAATADGR